MIMIIVTFWYLYVTSLIVPSNIFTFGLYLGIKILIAIPTSRKVILIYASLDLHRVRLLVSPHSLIL